MNSEQSTPKPNASTPPIGRAMAIDYGEKRIGVAITDPERLSVRGLETVLVTASGEWLQQLLGLVAQYQITDVVVGMPRNMDGSYGFSAEKVDVFLDQFEPLLPEAVGLHELDERLTSVIAEQRLREQGKKPSLQKGLVDQEAACLLLEDFLRQAPKPL
jgi:putative holliday junction resolvase